MDCSQIINSTRRYIGRGMNGAVYRITVDDQTYALKDQPFRTDDRIMLPAIREAVMLSSIQHPNVIQLYEACLHEGRLKLLLELGEMSLGDWDNSNMAEATRVMIDMTCAIDFIHRNHIYHNDLVIDNIVMVGGVPKLIDFGYAGAVEQFSDEDWSDGHGFPRVEVRECPRGRIFRSPLIHDIEDTSTNRVLFDAIRRRMDLNSEIDQVRYRTLFVDPVYRKACELVAKIELGVDPTLLFVAVNRPARVQVDSGDRLCRSNSGVRC
jgi:serine/threonine protein kinase